MSTDAARPNRRRWMIPAVIALVAIAAFFWWRSRAPRESTDDAQVSGHVSPVASRVGGTVTGVKVGDNQLVKAGDVLVELDNRDYKIALARAEADLANAEASFRAARTNVPITTSSARSEEQVANVGATNAQTGVLVADQEAAAATAKVASAKARLAEAQARATHAAQDLARLQPLAAKDEIPRAQLDAAVAEKNAADAGVQSADAAVREATANLDVAQARRTQAAGAAQQARSQATAASTSREQIALTQAHASGAQAQVQLAQAALEQAKLNLERTIVRSPADGIVSRRSVEMGQVVQPGQPLMAITSLSDVWVTANFKETQLGAMRPGQRAAIEVDAFGGKEYEGHIESIAAATGATFSLLPADNATGNFVKVVQRIPVKIVLDRPQEAAGALRPGMSVTAIVHLR